MEEEIEEAIERITIVGNLENFSFSGVLTKISSENINPILDLGVEKITKEHQEANKVQSPEIIFAITRKFNL